MTQGIQEQEIDDALRMQYAGMMAELLQLSRLKLLMGDLLAIIHHDGGHHEAEVGTAQAIKDAIIKLSRKDIHSDMYGSNSATSRRL